MTGPAPTVQTGMDGGPVGERARVRRMAKPGGKRDGSKRPLRIHAGVRLCQLVLMRTEGRASYAGRFADQDRI